MADQENPFAPDHLVSHVKDATYFEVPRLLATDGHLQVPQFRSSTDPLVDLTTGTAAIDDMIEPLDMKVTKSS